MPLRMDYWKTAPEAVAAMREVNAYLDTASCDQKLRFLLEVRVSQINGCTYCIARHKQQALSLGEDPQRLAALAHWRTSGQFTQRERAALRWAEEVTRIVESRASDEAYQALRNHFDDREIVDLTLVATSMNAWNRLAIAFGREAS